MKFFGNNKKDTGETSSSPVVSEKTKQSASLFKRTASKIGDVLKNKFSKSEESSFEPMSNAKYLGEIYKMMVQNRDDAKLDRQQKINRREEEESEDQKRHEEIIKALSLRRIPKPKKVIRRERKAEEAAKKKAPPKQPTKPQPPKPQPKPQPQAPKPEAPKPQPQAPKPEAPKPQPQPPKPEAPKPQPPKPEAPKPQPPKPEPPKPQPPKPEPPKPQPPKKTEPVREPPKQPPKKAEPVREPPKQPSAQPARPQPGKTSATRMGREGEGLKGLDSAARASNIKKELNSLGASSVLAGGILLVASKETAAGETLTEAGPVAYKNTWRNMESGKSKIPADKYKKIAAKDPSVPQSGPGAGTAYMNFTFAKKWSGEKWKSVIEDPDQNKFFEAVGYHGGTKYMGRSLIGITHEGTYKAIGKFLGLDLVNNPELINRDVQTTTAATLAYLALLAGNSLNAALSIEKMKAGYEKGLRILNSYTNQDDLDKAVMLLTAGKGNVDISNVEQVRAAFSGNGDRPTYLRQQLESGKSASKLLGITTENLDLHKESGKSSPVSNNTTNNNYVSEESANTNRVDDRPAHKRK
jgi:hypothetical protein